MFGLLKDLTLLSLELVGDVVVKPTVAVVKVVAEETTDFASDVKEVIEEMLE